MEHCRRKNQRYDGSHSKASVTNEYRSKKVKARVYLVVIAVWTLFLIGCSRKQNINEQAIETVVQNIFTCPNEDLDTIYDEMLEQMANAATLPKGTKSALETYDQKLEEIYSPYFTEKGYEAFYRRMIYTRELSYHSFAKDAGYEIEVEEVEIKRSKSIPSNYSFTAHVYYGKIGAQKEKLEIEGSAQIYEQRGKLSFINIIDPTLMKLLMMETM